MQNAKSRLTIDNHENVFFLVLHFILLPQYVLMKILTYKICKNMETREKIYFGVFGCWESHGDQDFYVNSAYSHWLTQWEYFSYRDPIVFTTQ